MTTETIEVIIKEDEPIQVALDEKYLYTRNSYDKLSQDWAMKTDGKAKDEEGVEIDYSSKAYAIGGVGTETNNSKYYKEQSALSASASANSATTAYNHSVNASVWAEGTDEEVQELGGEHSAKGWQALTQPIQYTTMPVASEQWNEKIIQYTGTTTDDYTQGYFYKCILGEITPESATISVVSGSFITGVSVNVSQFKTKISQSGEYEFVCSWATPIQITLRRRPIDDPLTATRNPTLDDRENHQFYWRFVEGGYSIDAYTTTEYPVMGDDVFDTSGVVIGEVVTYIPQTTTFTLNDNTVILSEYGIVVDGYIAPTDTVRVSYNTATSGYVWENIEVQDKTITESDISGTIAQSKITNLATDLSSKAKTDLSNVLSNIDYVIESKNPTNEDKSWYRVYKSGWCEQGGYVVSSGTTTDVSLSKTMSDNYNILLTQQIINYSSEYNANFYVRVISTTGFTVRTNTTTSSQGFYWEVKGMIGGV